MFVGKKFKNRVGGIITIKHRFYGYYTSAPYYACIVDAYPKNGTVKHQYVNLSEDFITGMILEGNFIDVTNSFPEDEEIF